MEVPSLNDLVVDGTLNTTYQSTNARTHKQTPFYPARRRLHDRPFS